MLTREDVSVQKKSYSTIAQHILDVVTTTITFGLVLGLGKDTLRHILSKTLRLGIRRADCGC